MDLHGITVTYPFDVNLIRECTKIQCEDGGKLFGESEIFCEVI